MTEDGTGPLLTEENGKVTLHPRKCPKCEKWCDGIVNKWFRTVVNGMHYIRLGYYCSKCKEMVLCTQKELDLVNSYTIYNPEKLLLPNIVGNTQTGIDMRHLYGY